MDCFETFKNEIASRSANLESNTGHGPVQVRINAKSAICVLRFHVEHRSITAKHLLRRTELGHRLTQGSLSLICASGGMLFFLLNVSCGACAKSEICWFSWINSHKEIQAMAHASAHKCKIANLCVPAKVNFRFLPFMDCFETFKIEVASRSANLESNKGHGPVQVRINAKSAICVLMFHVEHRSITAKHLLRRTELGHWLIQGSLSLICASGATF